ncbi:CU044_2847 family protein [Micromonospora chalcea]|uniref:CU044_2847 family protein n=1 Tax=Micromonospora chalcea TaxID=1874 RepID=UPI0033D187AB
MVEPVRLRMPNGQEIWARVAVEGGPADVAWRGELPSARLDDLVDTVQAVAASVREALSAARPDGWSVEFGIELAVKSGKVISVLTETGAKASLRVTLNWSGNAPASAACIDDEAEPPGDTGP